MHKGRKKVHVYSTVTSVYVLGCVCGGVCHSTSQLVCAHETVASSPGPPSISVLHAESNIEKLGGPGYGVYETIC